MTPTAPAAFALFVDVVSGVLESQGRSKSYLSSAIFPVRLPAGSALHAVPEALIVATSTITAGPAPGAVYEATWEVALALNTGAVAMVCKLPGAADERVSAFPSTCELLLAPAAIAYGMMAGSFTELSPTVMQLGSELPAGPQFPAETITGTPAIAAFLMAVYSSAKLESVGDRPVASPPPE